MAVGLTVVAVGTGELDAVAVVLEVAVVDVGLVAEAVPVVVVEGEVGVDVGVAVGVEQPPFREAVSLADATVAPERWSTTDAVRDASHAVADRTCICINVWDVPPAYGSTLQVSLPCGEPMQPPR